MIPRTITPYILKSAEKMPVIVVLGPRQSGKTTLVKAIFKNYIYISLENYEEKELAISDPNKFLSSNENPHGIILDEIQNAPKLLSYIQTYVDTYNKPGYIILTGSQNLLMSEKISQTLAGRASLFTLLPLSIEELKSADVLPKSPESLIFNGGYPRIYSYNLDPDEWYADYLETYVERDVRQIINVVNLGLFKKFIRLCAGRIGQILNITSLSNDCGIDVRTAKQWLSVLEASYIIFLLQPHYENFSKRLIKSPKIYFYDTGVACSLLGIDSSEQLNTHYIRGNLFECLIISEIFKHYYNIKKRPNNVYFWRDQSGLEIDCIIQKTNDLVPIEIKSGSTISTSFFSNLISWSKISENKYPKGYLIYAGNKNQDYKDGKIVSWDQLENIFR